MLKTLVVILGSLRGGEVAWKSLRRHVVEPFHADVALISPSVIPREFLQNVNASYVLDDGEDFAMQADTLAISASCEVNWKVVCKGNPSEVNSFAGGLDTKCGRDRPGSTGLILLLRWKLFEFLKNYRHYDRVIVTRSDFVYLCPFSNDFLSEPRLYIPKGEEYGGVTDRFIAGRYNDILEYARLGRDFFCHASYYERNAFKRLKYQNSESLIKYHLDTRGIPYTFFSRNMFTVRSRGDETRWSEGVSHPSLERMGLKLKYPDEYTGAKETCDLSA